tara:strand:+ start:344 stop:526 length:183 start_codon:yes stop_codon:yes gene_type:complete
MSNEVIFYGEHTEATIFEYLNALRDEGSINMMGAGRVLQQEFGLGRYEARDAVKKWMGIK